MIFVIHSDRSNFDEHSICPTKWSKLTTKKRNRNNLDLQGSLIKQGLIKFTETERAP